MKYPSKARFATILLAKKKRRENRERLDVGFGERVVPTVKLKNIEIKRSGR